VEGDVLFHGKNIYDPDVDPVQVRRRIGMVFQKPNPFPKSIYENVAWGARINGFRGDMDQLVEESLRAAALWDEVKDRLDDSAFALSGGQKQRLCLARSLALEPDVILLDNPTSGLDPISTSIVEQSLSELKKQYTIIMVPHSVQQASRVADRAAFLLDGEVVEIGDQTQIFVNPREQRTEGYVTGRFG
jgi:phosphate transport system ATP-binding protein